VRNAVQLTVTEIAAVELRRKAARVPGGLPIARRRVAGRSRPSIDHVWGQTERSERGS
jgi:hypothetical protein